jgi:DNA-binding CsgD family transcriptional regulator
MEAGAWKSCTELAIQEYHNEPTIIHHKENHIFGVPKHRSQDEPTKGITLTS